MILPRAVYLIVGIAMLIVGCSPSAETKPPKIRYGHDSCGNCHMIISSAPFAASLATRDEMYHKFDDIGCMLHFIQSRNDIAEIWVNDYATQQPIKAHYAFYIKEADQRTPMGYGILAFATKESAQKIDRARVLSFDDLLKQFNEPKTEGGVNP